MRKKSLFDLCQTQFRLYLEQLNEKPFRAAQIMKWIYHQDCIDIDKMHNIPKALKSHLIENFSTNLPEVISEHISCDGTIKWLLRIDDTNIIETVFIPEKGRGTLCISSQVGCALRCSFCATGLQGLNRNLSTSEIIMQVWLARKRLTELNPGRLKVLTNVVFMGMGEPLLNEQAVYPALSILLDDIGFGLSKYRVTISSSGIVPALMRLKTTSPVALAISLHAPNDALRNILVPINEKYPLDELLNCLRNYYPSKSKRYITFEYVMLSQVNDTQMHARQLINKIKSINCKLNLIPFNPYPGLAYKCSDWDAIYAFQNILHTANIRTTIRKTRGDDIKAACGQLAGRVDQGKKRKLKQQTGS